MENKSPLKRLTKFFSDNDFDFNINIGQEYFNNDLNVTLFLYRVDSVKSDNDDIYGEAGKDQIIYLPKVEINCLVSIEGPKNTTYKTGLIKYLEPGNLKFHVYIKHLEELGIDIKYGDYIGYPENDNKIRYYTVTDAGNIFSDTKHNMYGYKPYYRTILCVPTQENEFRGL